MKRSPLAFLQQLRPSLTVRDGVVLVLCIAVISGLALNLHPEEPPLFDENLLAWIGTTLPGPLQAVLVQIYRLSGVGFTFVLVLASLIYVTLKRWWRDLTMLVVATGGILLIVDRILKPLFDRSRPPEKLLMVDGRSFPSGHAAGGVVFYFAMATILAAHHPRLRWPLMFGAGLWVALVWLSTLVVRAHWPSDLIAGGAVGLAWLTVCLSLWRDPTGSQP
ncbi:MAG: phosphatase PAP2 family protein [Prochlorococcaceae cyanobacterium]|jgi:membrane-associated phospholipid phosphatase